MQNSPLQKIQNQLKQKTKFDYWVLADIFMERYGWTYDQFASTDIPVILSLLQAMEIRAKAEEAEIKKAKRKRR